MVGGTGFLWSRFASALKHDRGGSTCFIPFKTAWTFAGLEMALWVSLFPVPVVDGKAGINGEDIGVPSAASKLLELVNSCPKEGQVPNKEKVSKEQVDDILHRAGC